MTDLREQLLKAGLVSKESAAAAAEPVRTESSRRQDGTGDRQQNRRNDGRNDARHNDRPQPRPNDRQQGRRHDGPNDLAAIETAAIAREQARVSRSPEDRRKAEQAALKAARAGRIDKGDLRTNGHRRFYFNTRLGSLSWLELNDEAFTRLEDGRMALVESPRGEAWLVGTDAAENLATIDPTWIRAWNRRSH